MKKLCSMWTILLPYKVLPLLQTRRQEKLRGSLVTGHKLMTVRVRRQKADQNCSITGALLEAAANTSHVTDQLSPTFGSFDVLTPVLVCHHIPPSFAFSE